MQACISTSNASIACRSQATGLAVEPGSQTHTAFFAPDATRHHVAAHASCVKVRHPWTSDDCIDRDLALRDVAST